VVFFNILDTSQTITSAGLRFVPFAEAEYPLGALKPTMKKMAKLSGPAAFAYYVEHGPVLQHLVPRPAGTHPTGEN
jgi:hypothetical protein